MSATSWQRIAEKHYAAAAAAIVRGRSREARVATQARQTNIPKCSIVQPGRGAVLAVAAAPHEHDVSELADHRGAGPGHRPDG